MNKPPNERKPSSNINNLIISKSQITLDNEENKNKSIMPIIKDIQLTYRNYKMQENSELTMNEEIRLLLPTRTVKIDLI